MIPGLASLFYRRGTVGSFSAIASPTAVTGVDSAGTVTSNACTASPLGGTAPYTYLWQYISGSTAISSDSGTSATTTFSATLSARDSTTGSKRCRITDSTGAIAYTNIVTISLRATSS